MAHQKIKPVCKKRRIYLVNGLEKDNEPAWYYLEVTPVKEPIFNKKRQDKMAFLNLREYGKILDLGWGDNPPEDIRKKYEGEEE